MPLSVNDGHGLYITPGSRVVVRADGEEWSGYVVGDNALGDLWVRDDRGGQTQVRWNQVSAAR